MTTHTLPHSAPSSPQVAARPAGSPGVADRLHSRYGTTDHGIAAPADAAANGVVDHLLAHRSVRAFLDRPLEPGTLETLVAAAQSAPTSSNQQAWSVVAITDPARKNRLAAWANNQAHISRVPLFLVWLADLSRLDRVAATQGIEAGANRYLEQFLVAAVDASLAAQNALVAAEALGLGTVYIGALRSHAREISADLQLPPHVFPLFGLCVGYPDPDRPASVKPRLSQAAVLHHETYSPALEAQAVKDYDEIFTAFQRSQGLPDIGWSAQVSQRVAGPQSLSGRHALKTWIHEQGFALE